MTPLFIKGRPICETCGKLPAVCRCETPVYEDLPTMPEWAYDEFYTEYRLNQQELVREEGE